VPSPVVDDRGGDIRRHVDASAARGATLPQPTRWVRYRRLLRHLGIPVRPLLLYGPNEGRPGLTRS